MPAAVLDTNVLVATAHRRDQFHEPARAIVSEMDLGELPTGHVTNYVLAETLNLVGERISETVALELLDRLEESAGFEVVHLPKTDFGTGQALYRQYENLTFVDAVTVAYVRRAGIDYVYSFDDDFDTVDGATRLRDAVNPFE